MPPPSTKRAGRILLWVILLCGCIVLGVFLWLARYASTPAPTGAGDGETVVLIPPGSSFRQIVAILDEKNLIKEDIRLYILARLHGQADKIRAGEFALAGGRKPLVVLEDLTRAKPVQHPVTIVEGLQAQEIADVFAAGDWCSEEEFLDKVSDREFIDSFGFSEIASLEGYLYPDTYYLTRIPTVDAEAIITMMVKRFFFVWDSIAPAGAERHETVILASIVEKETGDPSERPRIASVFSNRLQKGMRLQSDPTVIYGLRDYDGNITREDLRRKTPYNTYVISGLPEGPICNPGRAALEAVLQPAQEEYLYFVSKNDGTHHFSTTLREHNRAVNKYQRTKR